MLALRSSLSVLRKVFMFLVAPIYSLIVAVMILALSSSSYEFMIGEVQDGEEINYCNLPKPSDDPSTEYAIFTGILVLGLLAYGAIKYYRTRSIRPSLVCGVLLTMLWGFLFVVRGRFVC